MINRFFAIKFPTNANLFNFNGINGAAVVESWGLVAMRFKSIPGWWFTKTKKSKSKTKNNYIPSERAVSIYMEKNEIGPRTFKEIEYFAKESLHADLKKIEKQIDVHTK
jgi:hypothetical protein